MRRCFRSTVCILLGWLSVVPICGAFSTLYVFGDGACTTTNGPGGSAYFGKRYSNGRVWVEVLAQRQGLTNNTLTNVNWSLSSNNCSYYGHYSSNMATNVCNFNAPTNANQALFVIWACDADFVWNVQNYSADLAKWTNSMNRTLTNYFKIITNLYAKGARTMIMPNAVDETEVPFFQNYQTSKNFVRQRILDFNARFAVTVSNTAASLPGLAIYIPDMFSLLDDIVTNPASYGLIKPGTYVIKDLPPSQWNLDGPGTNYVFWDDFDPTAKAHAILADFVQQVISPAQITALDRPGDDIRLDATNMPVGLNGVVEYRTNLTLGSWITATNFTTGTNAARTILVPDSSDPLRFYRLRFPCAWCWP